MRKVSVSGWPSFGLSPFRRASPVFDSPFEVTISAAKFDAMGVAAMKAVQMHGYGGVDQLRYEYVLTPNLAANEVLVRLAATSVNPIDWKIRCGDRNATVALKFQ